VQILLADEGSGIGMEGVYMTPLDELERLFKAANEVTNGPVRKERAHDLWVEVRAGFGLSNRMVADCMKEREADLYVFLRNHAEALIEAARAAEESPLMKELCEDCCGRGRVVIGEDHTEIDCPNCSGTGLAVPEFAPIRSALSRLKGSAAKEAKG
jgi:ribosomal protein S27E